MNSIQEISIAPRESWAILQRGFGCLVDVRTQAEWTFVGLPNLMSIKREVLKIEWLSFPDSVRNVAFFQTLEEQLRHHDLRKNSTIFFLCRSGHRSLEATKDARERGFEKAFNVLHGFEGDKDNKALRGNINGWKKDSLPWHQS